MFVIDCTNFVRLAGNGAASEKDAISGHEVPFAPLVLVAGELSIVSGSSLDALQLNPTGASRTSAGWGFVHVLPLYHVFQCSIRPAVTIAM